MSHDILSSEKIGDELYDNLKIERPSETSSAEILSQTFKSCNKKKIMKLKDRIVVLQGNCKNLSGRCAILSQCRYVSLSITKRKSSLQCAAFDGMALLYSWKLHTWEEPR